MIFEKPILFSGPMVRAILAGQKTQTRRVCKGHGWLSCAADFDRCPYGQPGDQLWVRETWKDCRLESKRNPIAYRASWPRDDEPPDGGWKPSIFMPRRASRITLELTRVRVELVQEITEGSAADEGVEPYAPDDYRYIDGFRELWNSINSKRGYGWDVNPLVWVLTFKVV